MDGAKVVYAQVRDAAGNVSGGTYPEIDLDKYHIDILVAHFVNRPEIFDVVVGSNLFGDILSDLGPGVTGTIGIAPSANINPELVEPQEIIRSVSTEFIPALLARNPGVRYGLEGASEDQIDFLFKALIALATSLFMIYALIAIPLHSYSQPLIIMVAQPLAVIGGVAALNLFDHTLNVFSMTGLVLLIGLVAKNSILLVDLTIQKQETGLDREAALRVACPIRLRPILMTSLPAA